MVLFVASCAKNENVTFGGEFLQLPSNFTGIYPRVNDGAGIASGFTVGLAGSQKSSPVSFTFEIDPESTAVENLHYVIDSNTGSIAANSNSGDVPITILDDNIAPGEKLLLVVKLTAGDVALNENYTRGDYTLEVLCGEDGLEIEYNFTNFDNFSGDTFTGEDELKIFNNTPGSYVVEDFSFGSWPGAYGISPPTGTLLFKEKCGTISMNGTDNYGDVWTMTEILESGGPNFTFKYENTYPEFGTVTLTKKDGTNWPPLQL